MAALLQILAAPAVTAGTPASMPARGMLSFGVMNVTPFFYSLANDQGLNLGLLPPWCWVTGQIPQETQTLTVTQLPALPQVEASAAAPTTSYAVFAELAQDAVAPAVVQLSVASAANSSITVTGGDVTVKIASDGNTVSLEAGTEVAITGTVTIAGDVSVTNTPTVEISGSGNTVQLAAGSTVAIDGDVTVTGGVEVTNSPTVAISATDNTVQLASGTEVAITGDVTVAGSVEVSNEPTVNISGTGNTVQLAAGSTVAIDGDVTVTGGVEVTNSPTVAISATDNTVQLASGTEVAITGDVTVAGSVEVSNEPTVNISGTGNTVALASGTSVDVGSITSTVGVELNATGPVSVQNELLPVQNLVYLGTGTVTITNLLPDTKAGTGLSSLLATVALVDGVMVAFVSHGGYEYSCGGVDVYTQFPGPNGEVDRYGAFISPVAEDTAISWNGNYDQGTHGRIDPTFFAAFMANHLDAYVYNNTGSTIASDTVTIYGWLIKAQVDVAAGTEVGLTSGTEVAITGDATVVISGTATVQQSSGEFGGNLTGSVAGTVTDHSMWASASNQITHATITFANQDTAAMSMSTAGTVVLSVMVPAGNTLSVTVPLEPGVPNSGETCSIPGNLGTVSWSAVTLSSASRPVPA